MIPILYDASETTFTSNGLGRLAECTKCTVTEARNGIYECQFTYPVSGAHYNQIQEGRIIYCIHDDVKDGQPFDIYARSAVMNGLVTFYARHINYRQRNIILKPHTSGTVIQAMQNLSSQTFNTNPFTYWTDKQTVATFKVTNPVAVKTILCGVQGSILDVYGGEYEFDKFNVKLHASRGQDKSATVKIAYGKNLTDIRQDYSTENSYTAVAPYWVSSETDEVVYLNEGIVVSPNAPSAVIPVALDLSKDFETAPTQLQLRTKALNYLNSNTPWNPKETIKVNFVALWQTKEYENVAPLQRVSLCDKVSVLYRDLGVDVQKQVVSVTYDVLLERYEKMELGDNIKSLSSSVKTDLKNEIFKEAVTKSSMQNSVQLATQLITGGLGGHVVFNLDADGKPQEILIMDTEDTATAVNVLRINQNGIGFSRAGYEGPFSTAWTIDGHFVADFIDTGNLNASLLKTGIIMDQQGRNYWNLQTGEISISIDPGEQGQVTPADLARVQENARQYAQTAENNANAYTDNVEADLETQLALALNNLQLYMSSTYSTKAELNSATIGNIILQSPYYLLDGIATFEGKVYRGSEDITDEFPDNAFSWYWKSEQHPDKQLLGYGKTMPVDTALAKYGMTVMCTVTATQEPEYWTEHHDEVMTDHELNAFQFASSTYQLTVETALYQQNYTEQKFLNLQATDEGIMVEVGRKINEDTARSLITQQADRITTEVSRATQAEGTLDTRITQTASDIVVEANRAKGVEGSLSTRITANAEGITAESNRASQEEGALSSRISTNASSISTEVSRAKGVESGLRTDVSNVTQTANGLVSTVSTKVGKTEVISVINQSAESVSIQANKINLNGATTLNNNVKIGTDGKIEAVNGKFSGTVSASTITGSTINGGEINGTKITGGSLESTDRYGSYNTLIQWGNIYFNRWYSSTEHYAGVIAAGFWDFSKTGGTDWTATLIYEGPRIAFKVHESESGSYDSSNYTACIFSKDNIVLGTKVTAYSDIISYGNITASGNITTSGNIYFYNSQGARIVGETYEGGIKVVKLLNNAIVGSSALMSGYIFRVSGSGYFNGSVRENSDERKKNMETIPDADSIVMNLRPIQFTWKNTEEQDDKIHFGLGAQTTLEVLKDAGYLNASLVDYSEDSDEYGIAYNELAPLMLPVLQENRRRLEAAEKRIEELESRVNALERVVQMLLEKGDTDADT